MQNQLISSPMSRAEALDDKNGPLGIYSGFGGPKVRPVSILQGTQGAALVAIFRVESIVSTRQSAQSLPDQLFAFYLN